MLKISLYPAFLRWLFLEGFVWSLKVFRASNVDIEPIDLLREIKQINQSQSENQSIEYQKISFEPINRIPAIFSYWFQTW